MAKVDPYSIRRPQRQTFEKVFTDPINPDITIKMVLRKLSAMEQISALDTASDMIARYITGYGRPGKPDYVHPLNLPPVDGQAVLISESTARVAAFLFRAQTVPDSERYSFEEIVSFMVSDAFCGQFSAAVADVTGQEDDADPLASSGAELSVTASTDPQPVILAS